MEGQNQFQISIFKKQSEVKKGENFLISPLSIYQILSLSANGADGVTLSEMLTVLNESSIESLNIKNKLASDHLKSFVSSEMANAVFSIIKESNLCPEFLSATEGYDAKIDELQSASQVNSWVSEKTHDKITNVIDKIKENEKMILINAIYFKGNWVKSFDEKKTTKRNFYNSDETEKEVDFIYDKGNKYDYYYNEYMQAISINYKDDEMKALFILPEEYLNINEYISKFNENQYLEIINGLRESEVELYLPKFEIKYETSLKDLLCSMGMRSAFSEGGADFSKMTNLEKLYIGDVLHKTYIKLDEKGTEAAAVTVVRYYSSMCASEGPSIPYMCFDRPFLMIIRSSKLESGNDILFISKIEKL